MLVWLAVAGALLAAAGLAWQASVWVGPAAQRYRDTYTRTAETGLSEVFLFIDPARLFGVGVMLALLTGLALLALTREPVLALLAAVAAQRVPQGLLKRARERRLQRFERQLPGALLSLAGALRAGASLNHALRHLVELSEPPLAQEFGLMLREQRVGVPFDQALDRMRHRIPTESTVLVTAALRVAAASGGNLAETLDNIAHTLRARLQLQGKLRALTAQGRMQAALLAGMPLLVGFALYQLQPEEIAPLWQTPVGWLVLGVLLILETVGVVMIRRILRIPT
ncbi:pilus assembly protein [Bordetella genomosp. 5]|uniref:Pilus assembly protein n=1 Tax=Bordetella genomosp. 5 TaxID=1395608 RepID=A0A261TKJ3_9BORD|nr:type II secretion system F family protein [Bordetella genomosp. 5]OZI44550.1 pilus assembly protein [Bordetella genomosp. 5]OZI50119.1 pilus assembly protein [Bordetella genomosp. 5]